MPDADDLSYHDQLAVAVETVMQSQEREIKAWKQIAYNLACALELNHLDGIASLHQQMSAHGVSQ